MWDQAAQGGEGRFAQCTAPVFLELRVVVERQPQFFFEIGYWRWRQPQGVLFGEISEEFGLGDILEVEKLKKAIGDIDAPGLAFALALQKEAIFVEATLARMGAAGVFARCYLLFDQPLHLAAIRL